MEREQTFKSVDDLTHCADFLTHKKAEIKGERACILPCFKLYP